MSGTICKYRGSGKMTGFLQNHDRGTILSLEKYDLKITYQREEENYPISGGLVIEVSEDQFILAGIRFTAEWLPKRGENSKVDYISIEEGTFNNDEWIMNRRLNGDEGSRISVGNKPSALKIELYKYE